MGPECVLNGTKPVKNSVKWSEKLDKHKYVSDGKEMYIYIYIFILITHISYINKCLKNCIQTM